MVTIPGMVAALAAPALTLSVGRLDRRWLLLVLTGLIVLADLTVAFATDLGTVLLGGDARSRAGGFWAFSAAVGRRLVEAEGHRAVALILGGISVGTVAGVPLGTMVGEMAGWREAFFAAAGLGVLVLIAQAVLLPELRGEGSASFTDLLALLALPAARTGYAASALIAAAHFAAYTYVQPLLVSAGWKVARPSPPCWPLWRAGVLGTWAGERLASTRLLPGFIAVALTVAGSIALVGLGARHDWAVVLGMVSWGAAFGALPVCVQIWIHQAAPERFESGSALMVTVFQLAVAAGALIGGQWVDHVGLGAAFATGTVLALAAALVLMAFALSRHRRPAMAAP
jgi:predicted MFS family arabinose efflux permease